MKKLSHLPVIGDPSHATGKWYLVEPVALGGDRRRRGRADDRGTPEPDHALSDGAQSLTPKNFAKLMDSARTIGNALGRPVHPPVERERVTAKAS